MRLLSSWIDGFLEYTDKGGSPRIWRKWTAIFTVAAAMERKVALVTNKGPLYPNLYAILVGPAGAGKTDSASHARDMLRKLPEFHIASTSVSAASLMDELRDASRKIVRPEQIPAVTEFNSLTILSNELGVLIPSYENDFINRMTDIYDCKIYSERRRTGDRKFEIPAPQINFLAATTPSYLNNLMPEGAWDQGFISRTFLIYSSHTDMMDLFKAIEPDEQMQSALEHDLKEIFELSGKMRFTDEAVEAFRAWVANKMEPKPDHPKLQHYNSRRPAHLIKLCMIASASSSDSLTITLDHYAEALDWLMEAEAAMEDIFKSMTMGSGSRVIDETWHYAYNRWIKDKKPIPEALIVEFISQRVPVSDVARMVEVLTRSGILKGTHLSGVGLCYEPKPRK